MDRDKVTKPTAQIGFIKFVLIPMFETVMKVRPRACADVLLHRDPHWPQNALTFTSQQLFPQIEEIMVQPLRDSRDHYEELKQIDDAMTEVEPFPLQSLFSSAPGNFVRTHITSCWTVLFSKYIGLHKLLIVNRHSVTRVSKLMVKLTY